MRQLAVAYVEGCKCGTPTNSEEVSSGVMHCSNSFLRYSRLGVHWLFATLCLVQAAGAFAKPTLDDFWAGKAHFQQQAELTVGEVNHGVPAESATWFITKDGIWYAFSRVVISVQTPRCQHDHTRVVVRESRDKGRTWINPVTAIEPGSSRSGDGCAVLDGSTYYDASVGVWHILAQCLDLQSAGGWSLCHYTRRSSSPLGPFLADRANPVVRGGQLWSRICAGADKSCPPGVVDEGTPDIFAKRNGIFLISMHGFDPGSRRGFRGVVATRDFSHWRVSGSGLPNDASLSSLDCRQWFAGCVGFGEAATLRSGRHLYTIAEVMDKGLVCETHQRWVFALYRSGATSWPRSGKPGWARYERTPLLTRTSRDTETPCGLQYAKWISDGADIYLVYEDWDVKHSYLHRRLLKLVPGGGPPVLIPRS